MLGVAILISATISGLAGVNIALNKNITCDALLLDKKITDGDLSITNPVRVKVSCSQLYIYLGTPLIVHYVIVYEGTKTSKIGNWDYYSAYLKTSMEEQRSCAMYPRKAVKPQYMAGNRVNCMGWPGSYFTMVELVSPLNHGYTIAEIEVHSIGVGETNTMAMIYRGCYKENSFRRSGEGHSISTCGHLCRNYGFAYIKEKRCRCANAFQSKNELPANRCYYNCPNNPGKYCGGKTGYSVYIVNVQLPYYNGCYDEKAVCTATNCLEDTHMSPPKCNRFCHKSMFAMIKEGTICICAEVIPKGTDVRQNCDIPCTGDANSMCGGGESYSVYGTCVFGGNVMSCSDMIQCDDQLDIFGNCLGECKEGYTGDYCLEKDLRAVLFDYEPDGTTLVRPATTKKPEQPTTKKTTLIREKPSSAKAKDACEDKPCGDKPNTRCVPSNEGDSFTCDCLKGFFKVGEPTEKCEDIDECLTPLCDPETSICQNTGGGYFCDCFPGYALDDANTCSDVTGSEGEFDQEQYVMYIFYAASFMVISSLLGVYWYDINDISE